MKIINKKSLIILIFGIAVAITAIFFTCFNLFKELIFVFIPLPFSIIAYLSFEYPKDIQKHNAKLVFSIIIRYLSIALAIVIPMLLRQFIPIFNDINPFMIFVPMSEVLLIYILNIVLSTISLNHFKKVKDESN